MSDSEHRITDRTRQLIELFLKDPDKEMRSVDTVNAGIPSGSSTQLLNRLFEWSWVTRRDLNHGTGRRVIYVFKLDKSKIEDIYDALEGASTSHRRRADSDDIRRAAKAARPVSTPPAPAMPLFSAPPDPEPAPPPRPPRKTQPPAAAPPRPPRKTQPAPVARREAPPERAANSTRTSTVVSTTVVEPPPDKPKPTGRNTGPVMTMSQIRATEPKRTVDYIEKQMERFRLEFEAKQRRR